MEAQDAFMSDRQTFDSELAGLIDAAAATSCEHATEDSIAPGAHGNIEVPGLLKKRLRQNSDFQVPSESSKRQRPVHRPNGVEGHVHPDRRASFEAPGRQDLSHSSDAHIIVSEDRIHAIRGTSTPSEPSSGLSQPNPRPQPIAKKDRVVHAIRRHLHNDEDAMGYDQLHGARRDVNIVGVDRHIPEPVRDAPPKRPHRSRQDSFAFTSLPANVRERIFSLLLVDQVPLRIHLRWARTWLADHVHLPSASKSIGVYSVPTPLDELASDVQKLQECVKPMVESFSIFASRRRSTSSPCIELTTALLRVSRGMHTDAARIFYSGNTFSFPSSDTAWVQLESFLATIGPHNVEHLRSLRIHAPLWHTGVHGDFLEGAILDLTSPASRLAVIEPPAHDRLLSAIRYSVTTLYEVGKLTSLTFDLGYSHMDYWAGLYTRNYRLVAMADAEEHVLRKQQGIEMLKFASTAIATKPTLKFYHSHNPEKRDVHDFRLRLAPVIREAEKYGWHVEQRLYGPRLL